MKVRFFFLFALVFISLVSAQTTFQVDTLVLKAGVHVGEFVQRQVDITSDLDEPFRLTLTRLPGVSIDSDRFSLAKGENRKATLLFNATSLKPGVYAGGLNVANTQEVAHIPVIFEVESQDVFYDANVEISQEYKEVYAGNQVLSQITLFDLVHSGKPTGSPINLELTYSVIGTDGNVYLVKNESVSLDGQTKLTKTIVFPESMAPGNYIFAVSVSSGQSVGVSSAIFSIIPKGSTPQVVTTQSKKIDIVLVIFVGLIVVLFVGIVILFIYLIRDRDKMLIEMKVKNAMELRKEREYIVSHLKNSASERDIEREVRKRVDEVKKKQKERTKKSKK